MTTALSGRDVAQRLSDQFPNMVNLCDGSCLWVKPEAVAEVAKFLRDTPGLDFDYLASLTAVDFWDHFDVVYHLASLQRNHTLVLRCQLPGRQNLALPSVVDVWRGADLQEREAYDMFGIQFTGHPNMKRLLTWEGFPGHPLRKDWL
ncbi:MAG: NADH-quinone oxidoreductase subunit C [Chloroflexi bacterium]|nr:NADH-quinone oxidoreductase subunit C [Chloroflexota bacterium]